MTSAHRGLHPATTVSLVALLLASLTAAAPAALAHNPAKTVYEPAAFDGGLLVLGEEGTAALLSTNGTERWRANLSMHVIQAPAVSNATAATIARTVPDATPNVQGFDAEGPTWNVTLDEPGTFGFVVPAPDGFLAVSTNGTMISLTEDGTVTTRAQLPFGARAAPVQAPEGGWLIAGEDRRLAVVDEAGDIRYETGLGGRVSDLAVANGTAYAAFYGGPRGSPAVQALSPNLTTLWFHDEPGLRIGGELAIGNGTIAFGTYDPDGAALIALATNGTERWRLALPNATAAAASLHGDRINVVLTDGAMAVTLDGERRWHAAQIDPRIASPTAEGLLVFPSGADDRLVALNAANGTTAWTWSDGVAQVPWSDESLDRSQGGGSGGEDAATDDTPLLPAVVIGLALLAAGALVIRRQR